MRRPDPIRPVILASFIGTTIEWYDFFLYGTAAALVFNQLFFPTLAPLAGTLSSYGTFAVGFVARPLGGALFGHYGDRVGRKPMLVWSLLIMGVATALIGVLPGSFRRVRPGDDGWDLFAPFRLSAESAPGSLNFLPVVARLKPGATRPPN